MQIISRNGINFPSLNLHRSKRIKINRAQVWTNFTFLTLAPNLYFTYMVFQPSRETEDLINRKSMIPIGPKISISIGTSVSKVSC